MRKKLTRAISAILSPSNLWKCWVICSRLETPQTNRIHEFCTCLVVSLLAKSKHEPYTLSQNLKCDRTRESHKILLFFHKGGLYLHKFSLTCKIPTWYNVLFIWLLNLNSVSTIRPRIRASITGCNSWLFTLIRRSLVYISQYFSFVFACGLWRNFNGK